MKIQFFEWAEYNNDILFGTPNPRQIERDRKLEAVRNEQLRKEQEKEATYRNNGCETGRVCQSAPDRND